MPDSHNERRSNWMDAAAVEAAALSALRLARTFPGASPMIEQDGPRVRLRAVRHAVSSCRQPAAVGFFPGTGEAATGGRLARQVAHIEIAALQAMDEVAGWDPVPGRITVSPLTYSCLLFIL